MIPEDNSDFDIYSIGFQEAVDLNTMNVVMSNYQIEERVMYWQQQVEETIFSLNKDAQNQYTLLQEKHLVGIILFIYVKNRLLNSIRDLRSSESPCGVLGIMGNKGGVCIRFDVDLSSFCFVCSHFHAGREGVQLRNTDYQNIIDKTIFPPDLRASTSKWWYDEGKNRSYMILDHDIIFWLGDLNYRIDESIATDAVFTAVTGNNWQYLCEMDQLVIEMAKNNVFPGFHEGKIEFLPTYKFQRYTDLYENRSDKKLRCPGKPI